jgi:integrase
VNVLHVPTSAKYADHGSCGQHGIRLDIPQHGPHRGPGSRTRPPQHDCPAKRRHGTHRPLGSRTARASDLAIGERGEAPIFLGADGGASTVIRLGMVRRVTRRAGITRPVGPHTLRHAFITAALDAGVPLRDVQEAASHADPRTTMHYDRARVSLDRHAPTSWPPSLPEPPADTPGAPRQHPARQPHD